MKGYLNRQQLMRKFERGRTWLTRTLKAMQQSGRYPPGEIIYDGKLCLVKENAVLDWLAYKTAIKRGEIYPPYERRKKHA